VLAVCERGYGKRTPLEEFRQQNRGGKGIILIDASERNGPVVGLALVGEKDEVMIVTDRGQTIRTRVEEIRSTGRNAQGVKIMSVDDGERVVAVESVGEIGAEDAEGGDGGEPPAGAPSNGVSKASATSSDGAAGESASADAEGATDTDGGGGSTDGNDGGPTEGDGNNGGPTEGDGGGGSTPTNGGEGEG
jgi:DNA gyrase subunit A